MLTELRKRARTRQAPGRALGDAGLVAVGGLLMVLPGFLGDLVGLLCLVPGTRALPRALATRVLVARVPGVVGPVRVRSARTERVGSGASASGVSASGSSAAGSARTMPVIEGEVLGGPSASTPER